jgi:hypothetical protein
LTWAVLPFPLITTAALPSPVAVAVLLLPALTVAVVPLPVAVTMLLLPPVAVAVPPLVAVAVHRLQLVASAVLPAPRATARECSPGVVIATVVSLGSVSLTITPLTDLVTGTFGFFFADGAVDVVDAESVDGDVVDAESVDEDVVDAESVDDD